MILVVNGMIDLMYLGHIYILCELYDNGYDSVTTCLCIIFLLICTSGRSGVT